MFTQQDLDNLKEALVSGAATVMVNGRSITYRSKQDLIDLIKLVEESLAGDDVSGEDLSSIVVGGFNRKGE